MSLQDLINNNKLQKIGETPREEIKKRFEKGVSFFNEAKRFVGQTDNEEFIYKNIFDAVRKIAESLILIKGCRVIGNYHHKTAIQAAKFIMNDSGMEEVFKRFAKMSKNRNRIEYSAYDVSGVEVEQAIKDAERFIDETDKFIQNEDNQKKLI